ncbi:hypothetical protein Mgra_00001611 [Meloidogyne graminicola]|uniref:Uncharacterized protein n=1 Tax=Meloidogyne graminicola TaxID=189291 RepID=A0A8S9ZZR3_9BILA|nr:hypothetical protein Mgra_00001611 [Meloidogyne graminicola]
MLLDCSILENKILCTNTCQMFLIDSLDYSIISTFNVLKSSYGLVKQTGLFM